MKGGGTNLSVTVNVNELVANGTADESLVQQVAEALSEKVMTQVDRMKGL